MSNIRKIKFNLQADIPNKNGTIYPKEVLKEAVEKFNKRIKETRVLGEIRQPTKLHLKLQNAAFQINDIIAENDSNWYADIEILSTPMGDKLKEILDDPDKFKIVTIGYGKVTKDKDGNNIITKFEIAQVGIEPNDNCA